MNRRQPGSRRERLAASTQQMGLKIHIDGAARGNPGPAAAGVVIRDEQGRQILEAGYLLEPMTNNQAEYHALRLALQAARKWGEQHVKIFSDSELIVRQITGRYRVRNAALRAIFDQVQKLLLGFDGWQITHVAREQNARADELANLALDAQGDVVQVQLGDVLLPRGEPKGSGRPTGGAIRIMAECTSDSQGGVCPAACHAGQTFDFGDRVPAGLCLHAAQAMIGAVLSLRHSVEQGEQGIPPLTVRCSRQDCGAVFVIRTKQRSGRS